MKLRIKGNSIRLRLSQAEVRQCATDGSVSDCLRISPVSKLEYTLGYAPKDTCAVTFTNSQLAVLVPKSILDQWANTDQKVGIYESLGGSDGNTISLIIEKDFQCLTERPGEDESGLFPNPNMQHGK